MTRREIAAAATGGALDERIPDTELRKRLANEPGKFDVDRILPILANTVGWYRLARELDEDRLSQAEIADQARETAAAVGELIGRLANTHPDIKAQADGALWHVRGKHFEELRHELTPILVHLQAALNAAEADLRRVQVRKGPKRLSERDVALQRTVKALRAHSEPMMKRQPALFLAAELLRLCEPTMPMPTDKDELRKRAG